MKIQHKHQLLALATFLGMGLLYRCASEGALTGGPPDTTPPAVIFSLPEPTATNVPANTTVNLVFSEKMVPASVRHAVRVTPEPEGGFEIKTSWRKAKIKFNTPLRADQTYLVTLDKTATDLRQNGLDGTFILAFSTGNRIDNGVLGGLVVGDKDVRRKGDLLLYENTTRSLDSLRSFHAEYVFQPSDSGYFTLPYLVERPYMLFYHWDKNQNGRMDAGDFFGRPHSTTVYPQPDSAITEIRIRPVMLPPEKLTLLGARALSPTLLRLRFNRPVAAIRTPRDVKILVNGQPIELLGIAPVATDEYSILVHSTIPLTTEESSLWVQQFTDTTGTQLNSDTLGIQSATRRDSVEMELLAVRFENGATTVLPTPESHITMQFSLPVNQFPDSLFSLRTTGPDTVDLPGTVKLSHTMQAVFTPDSLLPAGRDLQWKFLAKPVRGWRQETLADSVYSGKLRTISPDSLGQLIITQNSGETLRLVLQGPRGVTETVLPSGVATTVPDLYAGEYTGWAYQDINSNQQYDHGGFAVHAAAEPFWVFPDMFPIRARWDYDVGLWDFLEIK
ncbi:MAG: Ig-like domain-containing protein [Candidatus Marinimicrobia bacterium]|nr:Ig-like domain-containing protein [Candidatus Neomarinimicrobiota bacterium]MCF7839429.1 Ig-like domain-containing protein [Candidatus Neomarinimicrobiota bacterium]MCF7902913.1 Ig-like domain-containing protein [Candidatus Neomarinimicrobiota bacterium]